MRCLFMVSNNNYIGVTDLPIEKIGEDNLRIITYIEGLSDFIRSCATPMTIALQGDWGTGKTSFMNLVIDQLNKSDRVTGSVERNEGAKPKYDKVETIVFNTWKYAQFNQEQNLSLSFLGYVISQLYNRSISEVLGSTADKVAADDMKDENGASVSKVFGRLALGVTNTLLPQVISAILTGSVPNIPSAEVTINNSSSNVNDRNALQRISYVDSAVAIEELKQEFMKAVIYKLETEQCDRVVIFIDDLDRLDPVIAVNLLEIIKVFLDVPKCVFVLSVDYSIVKKGVKLKNRDFNMDDEKAHNFFDKMIQVPFRIPMEFYNFEEFLKLNLPGIEDFKGLHKLILHSIGNNPRGVKRLLNSYYLISNIIFRRDEIAYSEQQRGQLVALLCMQLSHEPLYRYFCAETNNLDMLSARSEERIVELLIEANIPYSESNMRKHILFLKSLHNYLFGKESIEKIDWTNESNQEALDLFETTLAYANITSSTTEEIEDIVTIPLNEIENYTALDYGVVGLNCENFELKSKSANGLAFEMYEKIITPNSEYIKKLTDYKLLPQMKAAGIDKRLILPYLKQLSEKPEAHSWIQENIEDYEFKRGEYSESLSERQLPGVGYSIITNYSALSAIQNMYLILNYLEDPNINQTTVSLKKKKR